jgi:hypothetical protein
LRDPQPNFVPVNPIKSRRTQSNGISSGASKDLCSPSISSVIAMGNLSPEYPKMITATGDRRYVASANKYPAAANQKSTAL